MNIIVQTPTDSQEVSLPRGTTPDDIDWSQMPKDADFVVACTIPGCAAFGSDHVLEWGDSFHHVAFEWMRDRECMVSVDYFEGQEGMQDLEADQWAVNGILSDDAKPLTPERVKEWMANYNSAVCLAAELNAGEATC